MTASTVRLGNAQTCGDRATFFSARPALR